MVRHAWGNSEADVVAYMDVDVSTGLEAFPPLVRAVLDGADIAIGSRRARGARVERGLLREVLSRGDIALLKLFLGFPFSDAQCGFKAVSRKATSDLLPRVRDDEWFFDTELLVVAHREGYGVKEIPVRWVEDRDSRVRIVRTAWLDILGILRMMRYRR